MSKKDEFIKYIEKLINEEEMSKDAKDYWEALKVSKEIEKPTFTDNGK